MSEDSSAPSVPNEAEFLTTLYRDGSLLDNDNRLEEVAGISQGNQHYEEIVSRVHDIFPVVDPRYLGYSFPSYTFIKTENHLEDAADAGLTHFNSREKAQLLGTVLGDVDLIHRRVDEDRWANAEFAKWAKKRVSFFEKFETYPVFQIARWYGKDIEHPIGASDDANTVANDTKRLRSLTEDEQAVIEGIYTKPSVYQVQSTNGTDLSLPDVIDHLDTETIKSIIDELQEDEILLGSSIIYDINRSPWQCAFMGLSLGAEDNRDEEPRMDLELDHDQVIDELQALDNEVLNDFTMPFITSGVGQGWADILLELRVQNLADLDEIAQKVRSINYVESTKTYMMTDTLINEFPN